MSIFSNKKCTCGDLTPRVGWTSQDYDRRYQDLRKCPIHSKVPEVETYRYERDSGKNYVAIRKQKDTIQMLSWGVMQAVGLKQVGIKAMDTPNGFRIISTFPTKEDARAYLLSVLDTVKREQKLGIRSKENLDPKFEGGLDFFISPVVLVVHSKPLLARGWEIELSPKRAARRKTQTDINYKKGRMNKIAHD